MIDPRFGRRPLDPRSRPARRSPQWLGGIECLESRIALAVSASYSPAGGVLSVIGTTAAQTSHFATDGFGDLAPIGRLPVIGISANGAGRLATDGFGDPQSIGRLPALSTTVGQPGHHSTDGSGGLTPIGP